MKTLRIVALIVCATVLAGSIARGNFTRGNHPSPVDSIQLPARPSAIGRTAVFLAGRLNCALEFR